MAKYEIKHLMKHRGVISEPPKLQAETDQAALLEAAMPAVRLGAMMWHLAEKLPPKVRRTLVVVTGAILVVFSLVGCTEAQPINVVLTSSPTASETAIPPTATQTSTPPPTETPTPTNTIEPTRAVVKTGGPLTEQQNRIVKRWEDAFDTYTTYWANAKPARAPVETLSKAPEHIMVGADGTLLVAWDVGEENLWSLPWYEGKPVMQAPKNYNPDGSLLEGSDRLALPRGGVTDEGVPFVLGASGGSWAKLSTDPATKGKVLEQINKDGMWEKVGPKMKTFELTGGGTLEMPEFDDLQAAIDYIQKDAVWHDVKNNSQADAIFGNWWTQFDDPEKNPDFTKFTNLPEFKPVFWVPSMLPYDTQKSFILFAFNCSEGIVLTYEGDDKIVKSVFLPLSEADYKSQMPNDPMLRLFFGSPTPQNKTPLPTIVFRTPTPTP